MHRRLNYLIEAAAQAKPGSTAVRDGKYHLTYGELQQRLEATAGGFQALGLTAGTRIAVYLPKQLETVEALFAAPYMGGIFVPINPVLKPAQVAHILQDSGATALVTSAERATLLTELLPRCKNLQHLVLTHGEVETNTFSQLTVTKWQSLRSSSTLAYTDTSENTAAAILYTSGSTGHPKGVVLSHRNLVLGAESVVQYLGTQSSDRILSVLPLSFDYGLNQLITAFTARASVALLNYLMPKDVIRSVIQEKITTIAGVPSLWAQLAILDWPKEIFTRKLNNPHNNQHNENTLHTLTNSGGHLPLSVIKSLQQQLPNARLFLMYGLTEAFRSSYLPPERLSERPTSMGKAIPHANLAVVRPDGTVCPPGEPGELVHAGPLVAQGYWNKPEATARYFRSPPAAMANIAATEKVLWTGDTVTQDEDGYLYFIGREDDMIKTSGYRVSPTEVEEILHNSGLIHETAVFGVPHPTLGQAIVAVVSLCTAMDSTQTSKEKLIKQLLSHCRAKLPGFMLPAHIEQQTQLPKTANGKIDRQGLKQTFSNHFSDTL